MTALSPTLRGVGPSSTRRVIMLGFIFLIFLLVGAVVAGKWSYDKLLKPCGCKE
jgi:hypothetical protein